MSDTSGDSPTITRTYKYRLHPSMRQQETLLDVLAYCRSLYNAALAERRAAYAWWLNQRHIPGVVRPCVTYGSQAATLPALKTLCRSLRDNRHGDMAVPEEKSRRERTWLDPDQVFSQVSQDVLRRVDRAFRSFFRRRAAGERCGYPRFRSANRYRSFCYPQAGWRLIPGQGKTVRLSLSMIGAIKLILHRPLPPASITKGVQIVREGSEWYACITVEFPKAVEERGQSAHACPGTTIGIDVGIHHYLATSEGQLVENPRWLRQGQEQLARLQRERAHKKRGSRADRALRQKIARLHRDTARARADWQRKQARSLAAQWETIVVEDLQIGNMAARPEPKIAGKKSEATGQAVYAPNGAAAKSGLNTSIMDAGWGQFVRYLADKADRAGGRVVRVPPHNTSQRCSGCNRLVPKPLDERTHLCPHMDCRLVLDRDVNAARNILTTWSGAGQETVA